MRRVDCVATPEALPVGGGQARYRCASGRRPGGSLSSGKRAQQLPPVHCAKHAAHHVTPAVMSVGIVHACTPSFPQTQHILGASRRHALLRQRAPPGSAPQSRRRMCMAAVKPPALLTCCNSAPEPLLHLRWRDRCSNQSRMSSAYTFSHKARYSALPSIGEGRCRGCQHV